MNSTSHRISVTLCCAREDAEHLRPLVKHLRDQGIPTSLLEGIDEDPHRLGPEMDRGCEGSMLVACIGEFLGVAEFRRITGVYSARRGPRHYLSDLLVEPDEILAMAESIHAALARAQKATAAPRRAASERSGSYHREVVPVTGISAVGSSASSSVSGRVLARKRAQTPAEVPAEPEPEPEPESARSGAYALSGKQLYGHDKVSARALKVAASAKHRRPKIEVIEGARRSGASSTSGRFADIEADAQAPDSQVLPVVAASRSHDKWMPVVLFVVLIAVALTAVLVYVQYIQAPASAQVGARR